MAKSKGKKKTRFSFTHVSFGFAILIVIIVISYILIPDKSRPPLPFEEVYLYSKQLSRGIYLIDKSISDGFYIIGVPEKNIVFPSVLPRQKGNYRWNFSSIEVRIPKQLSVFKVGEEIRERISQLPIPTQITIDKKSENEIIYAVYCKGLHTHRLTITLEDKKSSHRFSYPKIGIIIDDLGYDISLANALLELDLALTFSVLPFTPNTRLIARKAWNDGRETMLHLPMEPMNYPAINPGDGVLLISMDREMILDTLNRDLSQIPFVAGVNNHMGSRFTKNRKKMVTVLAELKKKGLYYIDSRTSSDTVAFDVAKKMALRTASRDIFLDNHLSENALKIQMERLLSVARHKGSAIGIGHPHKKTLDLLKNFQTTLTNEAEVVPASNLVNN
ncbi:MAG: divergent polysaccharide deacetylase family protein [Deltaproteobacteria bacterium]|nr:divergent polysaccharide deacetylase family protein [Deltaproteobacteria bacterium]